jgi:hypothetical protein
MKIACLLISLVISSSVILDNDEWLKFLETNEHQVPKAVQVQPQKNMPVSPAQRKAVTRGAKWTLETPRDTNRASRK